MRHLLEHRPYRRKHPPGLRHQQHSRNACHRNAVRASDFPSSRFIDEKKPGARAQGKRDRLGLPGIQEQRESCGESPTRNRLYGYPAGIERAGERLRSGEAGLDGELGVHRRGDTDSAVQAMQQVELPGASQSDERPGIRDNDAIHDAALISSFSSSGG